MKSRFQVVMKTVLAAAVTLFAGATGETVIHADNVKNETYDR